MLARDRLNIIEVLISKALTDSYLRHGEFVIVHNVSKESDDMKDEIKTLKTQIVH